MSVPTTSEEYLARFHENHRVDGYGVDVHQVIPCPWCAAPDFQTLYPAGGIITGDRPDIDTQMETVCTCAECGRSGRALVSRDPGGVSFEYVQTGGDSAPEFLVPPPRWMKGDEWLRWRWGNEHGEDCPVAEQRAALLKQLARMEPDPADEEFRGLTGALPEYEQGGDQEAEECRCGLVGRVES